MARILPAAEPPRRPAGMSAEAGRVWDEVLAHASHIGPAHAQTLREYCETVAVARSMRSTPREWRDLVLLELRLARELLLTPSTSGRLAPPPPSRTRLARFLPPGA